MVIIRLLAHIQFMVVACRRVITSLIYGLPPVRRIRPVLLLCADKNDTDAKSSVRQVPGVVSVIVSHVIF